MWSAARNAIGRVTEKTGDVGKLRQTANGTVSGGAAKRAATAQMFYPELAKVSKESRGVRHRAISCQPQSPYGLTEPVIASYSFQFHMAGTATTDVSSSDITPRTLWLGGVWLLL
jgi:hypothetical protein